MGEWRPVHGMDDHLCRFCYNSALNFLVFGTKPNFIWPGRSDFASLGWLVPVCSSQDVTVKYTQGLGFSGCLF